MNLPVSSIDALSRRKALITTEALEIDDIGTPGLTWRANVTAIIFWPPQVTQACGRCRSPE